MRGMVPPDPLGGISKPQFAVVHMPRRSRKRFSGGCVDIKPTREQAIAEADPDQHLYAAQVLGPSKSSEGQTLFYLLEWLDADAGLCD